MEFDPTQAFVLIDDARPRGSQGARLFADPVAIIEARAGRDVMPALAEVRRASADGLFAAGFIGFEAGYALESRLADRLRPSADGLPLLWFGLFEQTHCLAPEEVPVLLGEANGQVEAIEPRLDESAHAAAVDRIAQLIAAGDIYQANLTFGATVRVNGSPLGLYRRFREAQAAPHGALVHTGAAWVLSFSPELFFELADGTLTARPMKGTAARAPTLCDDTVIATALAHDPKNRAENLMIVDLIRNDLSRVATAGSVEVSEPYRIETYPTIHQMTTTITAQLQTDADAIDVIAALFPCGSVTGAPKIRAMEVIAEVERRPRGLYTGSIGWLGRGAASFNVAIRTLTISAQGEAVLGLGSGIVADSAADSEWAECHAKAAFLKRDHRPFDLFETLRFTPEAGIERLDRHLARMRESAAYWDFAFNVHEARNTLQNVIGTLHAPARVRLMLSRSGAFAALAQPMPATPTAPVEVTLRPLPIAADDPRLFHKTSDRAFHDETRRAAGTFEVLFVRPDGLLTEGSFSNLFVPRDGVLLTPPQSAGLLPGVLRAELLDNHEAVEAELRTEDLRDGFLIGNALRGLIPAQLASWARDSISTAI